DLASPGDRAVWKSQVWLLNSQPHSPQQQETADDGRTKGTPRISPPTTEPRSATWQRVTRWQFGHKSAMSAIPSSPRGGGRQIRAALTPREPNVKGSMRRAPPCNDFTPQPGRGGTSMPHRTPLN